MDWKRLPDNLNVDLLQRVFERKYSNIKLDMIMTTDDAALIFAIKNRARLFSNAPIVFGGVVKEAADKILYGAKDVTGVYESTDPEGTMSAAGKMIQDIEKVYLLHDNSESGLAFAEIDKSSIRSYDSKIEIFELNNLSLNEVCEKVKSLDKKSIVMIDAYSSDGKGLVMPTEKLSEIVTENSSVPAVVLNGMPKRFAARSSSDRHDLYAESISCFTPLSKCFSNSESISGTFPSRIFADAPFSACAAFRAVSSLS
jgi:hypothetical protein